METKQIQQKKVKRESLRELAKQAGIEHRVYPSEIIGYEKIDFNDWLQKLGVKENERTKKLLELIRKEKLSPGPVYELPQAPIRTVGIKRYFLQGEGPSKSPWSKPMSRGVLISLIEAQKTGQFCRFEVWKPEVIVDPIVVGFADWVSAWNIKKAYSGGDCLNDCQLTYKICEWK